MNISTGINSFSLARMQWVTKRHFEINKRNWLLGYVSVTGGIIAIWLIFALISTTFSTVSAAAIRSNMMMANLALTIYPLAGLFLSISVFKELQTPDSAPQLLLLPATNKEKLMSAWIISFVLYTAVAIITILILAGLEHLFITFFGFTTINEMIEGAVLPPVPGLNEFYTKIFTYLIFNSVFLLGAVWFKRYNFLKTALSIIVFFIVLGLALNFLINVEFFNELMYRESVVGINAENIEFIKVIFGLGITFLFLVFSYIRLKNRQIA